MRTSTSRSGTTAMTSSKAKATSVARPPMNVDPSAAPSTDASRERKPDADAAATVPA